MPQLPLPAWPVIPAGGDLPVTTQADVLAVYPPELVTADPAPVRDALLAALTRMLLRHQELAGYAAAQADPGRATDTYEDGLFEDRGVYRAPGEADEAFRARAIATPGQVCRNDLLGAVTAIVGPYSATPAQLSEPSLDRLFIGDGTTGWHSFIGASPQYQDRLYPDDAALNGASRPQSDPLGARIYNDTAGRFFVVHVPDLGGIDAALQLIYNGTLMAPGDAAVPELGGATPPFAGMLAPGQLASSAGGTGLYLGDGSNASGAEADGSVATFLYTGGGSATLVYAAIVNAVERIRGASVRWQLVADL